MAKIISREIHLKSRPAEMPVADNFELAEVPVSDIKDGELLVRNLYMSVDPYMRGRMNDRKSYIPPFQIGQPLEGGAVGQVVASNNDQFKVGDYVSNSLGWREYFISTGAGLRTVDTNLGPAQAFLGTLGMPGMTAYFGLLDIGQPAEGETVFVSAAAGAVGSIVCQIAKLKGCRVVGSAGSDQKVAWLLEEAGVDAAFNYKSVDNLTAELLKHCPKGIDVYFENVGGDHLEAALNVMNPFGRMAMCGMIAQYNSPVPPPGPSNLSTIIGKRLRIEGFLVGDHMDKAPQFFTEMGKWISQGNIKWKETIVDGIENAPQAFIGLFRGENLGKMIVKVGPDPAV